MVASAVYLHIGAPKTGTSYLQRMIWTNKQSLFDQGFFMPPGNRRRQFDAVSDLRGEWWSSQRELTATWDLLAERVHENEGVAVVSEELLCATPPDKIERIVSSLAPVPVHVIHTARDIGRQVPAEWQQILRARSPRTYESWLEQLRDNPVHSFWQVQDPSTVYQRWEPFLEKGNFHVVTVPRPGSPSRLLWDRFASVIGADADRAVAPDAHQNQSLGLAESELLRRFNARLGSRFPMRDPYIRVVRDHLLRQALMGAPDALRIGVPAEFADWINERAEESVQALAGLGDKVDVVGDPTELSAHITHAERSPADQTDSELLEAALDAWVRQMEAIEVELDEQRERSREAVQERAALEAELHALRMRPLVRARRVAGRTVRRAAAKVRGTGPDA